MVILFVGLLMGALFILQQTLYKHWWDNGVTVKLTFEKALIHAGDQVKLFEEVENRKWLPLSSLKVKFQCSRYLQFADSANSNVTDKYYRNDLFSIMPYRKITRTHQILCSKRGYYGIYGIDLVGADLFFSEEMIAGKESDTVIYVIPAILPMDRMEPALKRINGEIATRRYELEDPFTYRGIREYEPFDEPKTINWKATAKTGELKVNIREHTAVSSVRIFMNLQDTGILRREELLEMTISLCAGIAQELLAQGIRVSIYANSKDCVSAQIFQMEGLSDITAIDSIYKALARLDLDASADKFGDAFREKLFDEKETLYTIFLSPDRHKDYQQVLVSYKNQDAAKGDFLWICPIKKSDEEKVEAELQEKTLFIVEATI